MKMIFRHIATYGSFGYKKGSGTIATFLTTPLVLLLHHYVPHAGVQMGVIILLALMAFFIVKTVKPLFNTVDPSAIVIDEGVGTLITFWALKPTSMVLLFGCLLFRFFDIFKPLGIKNLESLPGAWGIMADDMAAGFASALVLHIVYYGGRFLI